MHAKTHAVCLLTILQNICHLKIPIAISDSDNAFDSKKGNIFAANTVHRYTSKTHRKGSYMSETTSTGSIQLVAVKKTFYYSSKNKFGGR